MVREGVYVVLDVLFFSAENVTDLEKLIIVQDVLFLTEGTYIESKMKILIFLKGPKVLFVLKEVKPGLSDRAKTLKNP